MSGTELFLAAFVGLPACKFWGDFIRDLLDLLFYKDSK